MEDAEPEKLTLRPEAPVFCPTAKEVITIFHFLEEAKYFALSRQQALAVAEKAGAGCVQAAKRFVDVASLLGRAHLPPAACLEGATTMALRSDAEAEAFMRIFKVAYLPDALDLDLANAYQLAMELSQRATAEGAKVEDDYEELVGFCLSKQGLAESRSRCAALAVEVLNFHQGFPESIAKAYIKGITYLRDAKGPNLTSYDAKRVVLQLLARDPYAVDNFVDSYEFALDPKGLAYSRELALKFAVKIATLRPPVKAATQAKI